MSRLGFADYIAYLRSPTWARKKREYRESELPQDCMCGEVEVDLHHLTYERVGAERLTDLTPLCRNCHQMIHVLERRGEIGLDFTGFVNAERAARNQEAAEQRMEAARDPEREREQTRRESEMWLMRLRKAQMEARSRGVDISDLQSLVRAEVLQMEGAVAEHETMENLKARGHVG